jgi:hypothetical protein
VVRVHKVAITNKAPAAGGPRQRVRSIKPIGSVATEGDVLVSGSTGLGQVIVYSHPEAGGNPSLRPWYASGTAEGTDPALVSGKASSIVAGGSFMARVPVAAVPQGDVQLWARIFRTGDITPAPPSQAMGILWSVKSRMGANNLPDGQSGRVVHNFATHLRGYMVPLGRCVLPPTDLGPDGFVEIEVQYDPATPVNALSVDDVWMFGMEKGTLTVVDCGGTGQSNLDGSGLTYSKLRIAAPSLDRPHGGILVANNANFSDERAPSQASVLCDQVGHRFDPFEGTIVTVITDKADNADTVLEHYPWWHTHAGA